MEVLLLTDIPGIGKKNDLLVVKSGFALNHLLPNRKALVVTPNVRKRYADQIKQRAMEREKERELLSSLSTALGGKTVHVVSKVAKTGKLYASVSPASIVEAIKKEHHVDLQESSVSIPAHIKTVGTHTVQLTVGTQTINMTVDVQAEEAVKK